MKRHVRTGGGAARAGVVLSALALLATAGVAWPTADAVALGTQDGDPCPRQQLDMPPGAWRRADVFDADPSGRFQVGYGEEEDFTGHLIRWVDGVAEDLGTAHPFAQGVNAQGDIVGSDPVDDGTNASVGWLYHEGRFTELPGLGADFTPSPQAVNADGTVAGYLFGADGWKPATWSADGAVHPLALPSGTTDGEALDVDADGTVVGDTWGGGNPRHATRWRPDGSVELLPENQPGPNSWSAATAVRGGTVLGYESHENSTQQDDVLRWRSGSAARPEVLGEGVPQAVNSLGSVVFQTLPYIQMLLVADDGDPRTLPTDDSVFPTSRVVALTDDGVAYGHWMNSTPVRWDCRS